MIPQKIKQAKWFMQHQSTVLLASVFTIGIVVGRHSIPRNVSDLNLWLDKEMYEALVSGSTEFIRFELEGGPTFLVTLGSG